MNHQGDDDDCHFTFCVSNEFSDVQSTENGDYAAIRNSHWQMGGGHHIAHRVGVKMPESFSIFNLSHLIGFDTNCRRTSPLHTIKLLSKA